MKRSKVRLLAPLSLCLAFCFAPALAAEEAPITIEACTMASPEIEAADSRAVAAILDRSLGATRRIPAIDLEILQAVVSRHAPRHRVEKCGDKIVVNSGVEADALQAGLLMAADQVGSVTKSNNVQINVVAGDAYLLDARKALAFQAVEQGRTDEAIRLLAEAMQTAPYHPNLAGERAFALNTSGRSQEALEVVNGALDHLELYPRYSNLRALLLRTKGYALGELARWDEAEAAYTQSLKLEPGNDTALNELKYIASRKAGEETSPVEVTVYDPSKAPKPPK
jgi:Flp pilus assembly protein TadD